MSPYYRQSYGRGPGMPFGFHVTWTRTVKWLMGINVGVFVLQMLMARAAQFWLIDLLVMNPREVFAFPPHVWQLVTYMFLHGGTWHLLTNMLGLFFFGGDVERALGTKRFLRFYFGCGIAGALLSCLLSPHAVLIGASAGVLGVLIAFAIFYPDVQIYIWMLILIPIRAKYVAVGLAVLNLLSAMEPGRANVAYWGHLGGMGYAFVVLWLFPRMGWRVGLPRWLSLSQWWGYWRRSQHLRQARRRSEVQEELDRILAKVHQEGLNSLTEGERRFLKSVSKRYGGK